MADTARKTDRALIALSGRVDDDSIVTDSDALRAAAIDESETEYVLPEAIVRARNATQVRAVIETASRFGVPLIPRGAGTGRVGGAAVTHGGWVIAFEGMADIREIDPVDRIAIVEPGVVTGRLQQAVESEGLYYPPDPSSWRESTLGGNAATNAGGPRAFGYGVTRDYVLGLRVVTGSGQPLSLGRRTTKGVTGYDFTALMVGSEGTLGCITELTLRLRDRPAAIGTLLGFFDREDAVGPAVTRLLDTGLEPRCIELLDAKTLRITAEDGAITPPPSARALLLVEFHGRPNTVADAVERAGNVWAESAALEVRSGLTKTDQDDLWKARSRLSRSLRRRSNHKLSEDVAVPKRQLGELLRYCRQLEETHRVRIATYGHAGDGNLHCNFLWDDPEERASIDRAIESLFRRVIELGGTLSGEHGIGALKAPYLRLEQSDELIALQRAVKSQFDPRGVLNPGKIFGKGHSEC